LNPGPKKIKKILCMENTTHRTNTHLMSGCKYWASGIVGGGGAAAITSPSFGCEFSSDAIAMEAIATSMMMLW
jgi:hypothetical protein